MYVHTPEDVEIQGHDREHAERLKRRAEMLSLSEQQLESESESEMKSSAYAASEAAEVQAHTSLALLSSESIPSLGLAATTTRVPKLPKPITIKVTPETVVLILFTGTNIPFSGLLGTDLMKVWFDTNFRTKKSRIML